MTLGDGLAPGSTTPNVGGKEGRAQELGGVLVSALRCLPCAATNQHPTHPLSRGISLSGCWMTPGDQGSGLWGMPRGVVDLTAGGTREDLGHA